MQLQKEHAVILKAAGAVVVAFFASIPLTYLGLVALMTFDFMTGFMNAWNAGKASASEAGKGITRKLMIIMLISAVEVLALILSHEASERGATISGTAVGFAGSAVAVWFCIQEAISVVENVAAAGVRVPKFLRDALAKIDSDADPTVPNDAGRLDDLKKL